MTKIKILIVDDLERVRQSLTTILQLMDDLEIIGEASNGLEAIQLSNSNRPDLVLMDLEMPELDGFEATQIIKERRLAKGVIVLTIHEDPHTREQAVRMGADAFVYKGVSAERLVETIRDVWKLKDLKKSK